MKKVITLAILSIAALSLAGVAKQLSVPNIESTQSSLFRQFDELQQLGAYVIADDGTKLGTISKGYDTDALGNQFGAGSPHKAAGLFNGFSEFGSEFGTKSAFNSSASSPPLVVIKSGNDLYSIGVLTVNPHAPTKGQRINPYLLQAWLKSK